MNTRRSLKQALNCQKDKFRATVTELEDDLRRLTGDRNLKIQPAVELYTAEHLPEKVRRVGQKRGQTHDQATVSAVLGIASLMNEAAQSRKPPTGTVPILTEVLGREAPPKTSGSTTSAHLHIRIAWYIKHSNPL